MENQPITTLNSFSTVNEKEVNEILKKELTGFSKKIVVLDDDPTGIQTVHGVYVYTDWLPSTLTQAFQDGNSMFFILTNSRSLSREETLKLHTEVAENLCAVSKKLGQDFLLISRADSTLRGHYPLETDTLKKVLEAKLSSKISGEIFCPFFPEGGRYTFQNVHYVKEGDTLVPAGETEFANDKSFSFHASDLTEYIEEKSNHVYKKDDCICISIEELRSLSYDTITQKLLNADAFAKIVVNAVTYTDLKIFVTCWIRAMKAGADFLARSAAALPKIIGNISDHTLLSRSGLRPENSLNGGLIIIGSHVKKTTEQFHALINAGLPLELLEFHVNSYFEEDGLKAETLRVLKTAEENISNGNTVLIYTSRTLLAPEGFSEEQLLEVSVKISEALTSIVSMLTVKPAFILAKGGITSSDVGTLGLHVKKALVLGQVKPGIPVWLTGEESKFPNMPYIIFPGNVGNASTLKEIIETLI